MRTELTKASAASHELSNDWFAQKQPTVVDLAHIVWRRLWVFVLLAVVCIASALYITHRMSPVWRAHAQLVLTHHSAVITDGTQSGYQPPIDETVQTQLTMLQDHEMAQRAIDDASSDLTAQGLSPSVVLDETPDQLQKAISVENPNDTDIIDLYVDANSPDRAAMLANAVSDAFIAWKKEIAQSNTNDTLVSLTVRADRAQAQMVAAEQAQVQFEKANHMVNVPEQTSASLGQYESTQASVTSLQQDLSSQDAELRSLGSRLDALDADIRDGTGVRDDSIVLGLQTQLNQLEVQRAQEALQVTAKYPSMLGDLDAQIADIKHRLGKAVQSTLDNKRPSLQSQGALFGQYKDQQTTVLVTQARLHAAQGELGALSHAIGSMPETVLADSRLQRNVDLARSLYTSLQASLNATRLEKDMSASDVQLVQRADVAPTPVEPRPLMNMAIALATALVLGVLAVLLIEQSDRRLRSLPALQSVASGPVIGVLPRMSVAQIEGLSRGELPVAIDEAYSLAAASLALTMRSAAPNEDKGQVILVTSGLPGEGKSVTSAALARALARISKRVVLIDADMRRPAQRHFFPNTQNLGLSDILEGKVTPTAAMSSMGISNMRVIHSGTPTEHPTELIARAKFGSMLETITGAGCTVVIDTPASSIIADAMLLAPFADCVLCVVGADQTSEDMVRATTASLRAAGPKLMTYILNRATHLPRYDGYYRSYGPRVDEAPALIEATQSAPAER